MEFELVIRVLIPVLLIVLIAFAIWAVVELALSLRRMRGTLDTVDKTVDDVTKKANPLLERATLTVDAVNLEIMRIDQILEDVEQLTDSANSAVDAVDRVANAPREIATSVAGFVRSSVKDRSRKRAVDRAMTGEERALSGADVEEDAAERPSGITIIESPMVSKASEADAQPTAAEPAETTADAPADQVTSQVAGSSEDSTE